MSRYATERWLWAGAIAGTVLAIIGWRAGTPRARASLPRAASAVGGALPTQAISDTTVAAIVDHDPFRLTRRPANVPYSQTPQAAAAQSIAPRPAPMLTGIIGGPPWEALLDGIPGRAGTVVARAGDTLSGIPALLVVRVVQREQVIIQSPDTTWTLTVRRPWQ